APAAEDAAELVVDLDDAPRCKLGDADAHGARVEDAAEQGAALALGLGGAEPLRHVDARRQDAVAAEDLDALERADEPSGGAILAAQRQVPVVHRALRAKLADDPVALPGVGPEAQVEVRPPDDLVARVAGQLQERRVDVDE